VRPGRAADHSPPSSAAVMEEYGYTSIHPLGHTGHVREHFFRRSSIPCRCHSGPGSSVGIGTDYGLVGPGLNPGGDEIFRPFKQGPGDHPLSCKMGTGSSPGVKCGRGVLLTTHPLLVPRSWNSRAIPLPTLWTTPGL